MLQKRTNEELEEQYASTVLMLNAFGLGVFVGVMIIAVLV